METTYCCVLVVIGYKAIMKLNVVEVSCRNKVACGYNVHDAIKESKHNKFSTHVSNKQDVLPLLR